jgi:hypothetical protein
MFSKLTNIDHSEQDSFKSGVNEPDFYLKNLAEYQKMLELLSVNEQLTNLLQSEELFN